VTAVGEDGVMIGMIKDQCRDQDDQGSMS
jgi:hypothetical protein